jgi:hypothetical protein
MHNTGQKCVETSVAVKEQGSGISSQGSEFTKCLNGNLKSEGASPGAAYPWHR